jgi:BclB C-terminal domain-containing protein
VGPASAGAIIPFASSQPAVTSVLGNGLADEGALVGFGAVANSVAVGGATIDLTGSPGTALDMAFVAPRNGTITSFGLFLSNVSTLALGGGTASVMGTIYHASAGSNTFSPLAVSATIPFTGTIVLGTTGNALTTGLSVPVIAGDRYILVLSATTTGLAVVVSLNVYASAGLNIV